MKKNEMVALVTGSNKGIGKAIADRFENEGIVVIRNGISESTYSNYIMADVGIKSDVKKIKRYINKNYNKLDILVNNAAFTKFIPHEDLNALTSEIIDKIFNVNVKGPIFCTQILKDFLSKSPSGLIINIASIAGITGKGSNIAYCASKSALINITKSLARSLAPVRVNSISPGLIETDFVQFPDGYIPQTISNTPLKRIGKPKDIADVAFSLVESKFITGENILVDGGFIIQ